MKALIPVKQLAFLDSSLITQTGYALSAARDVLLVHQCHFALNVTTLQDIGQLEVLALFVRLHVLLV